MAADIHIKGQGKLIPQIKPKPRKNQFDEILQESEQLLTSSRIHSDINFPNPDLTTNLKALSSLFLDNNSKFIELKRKLELYYLDARRERPSLHPNRSSQFTKLLYGSLHKLLNECIFTQSRKIQLDCLNTVYDWYYEKVGKENSFQQEEKHEQSFKALNETIEIFEIEDDVDPQGDLNEKNFDKLSHYSRRQISSAHSQRPTTAALTSAKWLEQRPPSAAIKVAPVQAYTGLSEPVKPKDNVEFESNYVNYKPLGGEAEKQMEKRYQTFRNRDLSEKRLRDEMNQKVHRWVSVRARRAEEQARRSESVRFASKFEQRAYSPSRNDTSASLLGKASYIDFTDELGVTVDNSSKDKIPETALDEYIPIHKMNKVSTIRKLHGEMIDAEASDETLLQDPSAIILSAYPQSTISSWIKKEPIRPLTAGSLPAPRSTSLRGIPRPGTATSQTRQVEELLEVKRRLASHNIPCSLEAMKYALLTPEDLPLDQLTNLCLPKPGSGLLLNPFIKIGKKKKKKKGKKGKKGKKAK